MARVNPVVERLQLEVSMLRKDNERLRKNPEDFPFHGCGDGSCIVARPGGMHTNGGCHCDERSLRQSLQWWKRRATFLQVTIWQMRDEPTDSGSERGRDETV